jgi:diacylglycerol kinase (ATP)
MPRPARPTALPPSAPRRRILIIANPAAGRLRRSERRLREIVAAIERRGYAVVVRRSLDIGDAERLAREAEPEFDVIVAAGGDGTVNAVANGIGENSRAIAVLPLGSANVLAREIGLPRRSEALAALLAEAQARPVWPGRIGDRLFLMMAGIGFDAEVVAAVDPGLKRRIGRLAFLWAILQRLARHRPAELSVRADGREYRAAALIAAKGRFYAGPFVIAPSGDIAEPTLDLVLFRDGGRIAAMRYLVALLLGHTPRLKSATCLKIRSASIRAAEPAPVHADGEIVGELPVEIGVAARPLLLIRP